MVKIYQTNYQKKINRILERLQDPSFDRDFVTAVEDFVTYLNTHNYELPTISKYLDKFIKLAQLNATTSLEKTALNQFLVKLRTQTDLSDPSRSEYSKTLKILLQHHHGLTREDPRLKILVLRTKTPDLNLEDKMLSFDEVKSIVDYSKNFRDRAFIMTLYESGCRINEFICLKFKDVVFDKYGVKLNVTNSKTYNRAPRLVLSTPYLAKWIELHPTKQKEDFLWLSIKKINADNINKRIPDAQKKPRIAWITKEYFQKVIKKNAKNLNIEKPVNFHNFRKSRASYLSNFLTDQEIKKYMGWSRNSRMASIYIHMDSKKLDLSVLRMNNIQTEQELNCKIEPNLCRNCHVVNETSNRFCSNCGLSLDPKFAIEINVLQNKILTSGLSIRDFVEANSDLKYPEIIEELTKLNRKILLEMLSKKEKD